MWNEKEYTCRCHVCGLLWVLKAEFLSSPMSDSEGHPCVACGHCKGTRAVALAYWHNDSPWMRSLGAVARYDDTSMLDCVCHRKVSA